MKRIKVVGLGVVMVFALAAVFAGAASAKSVLVAKTAGKGALKPGEELRAESSDLTFVTSTGNLECTSNILVGTVEVNGAAKDKGPINTEKSTGGEAGGLCKTTTGLGPAEILSEHLPWSAEFNTSGISQVKGKKIAFTATFPAAGGAKCTYEAAKVKATFNTAGVVTETTTNQVFKANQKISNPACPKEGKLSGTFKLFSGSEAVEDELHS